MAPVPGTGFSQLFPVGEKVVYWSRSTGMWVPATVLGHNYVQSPGLKNLWSYQLDVQPQAPPSLVAKGAVDVPYAGYPLSFYVVPATPNPQPRAAVRPPQMMSATPAQPMTAATLAPTMSAATLAPTMSAATLAPPMPAATPAQPTAPAPAQTMSAATPAQPKAAPPAQTMSAATPAQPMRATAPAQPRTAATPKAAPAPTPQTPAPAWMARHASTPNLWPTVPHVAQRAMVKPPCEDLHATTRLPRHSTDSLNPGTPITARSARSLGTPITARSPRTPVSARSPAGSPVMTYRQVRLSQTPQQDFRGRLAEGGPEPAEAPPPSPEAQRTQSPVKPKALRDVPEEDELLRPRMVAVPAKPQRFVSNRATVPVAGPAPKDTIFPSSSRPRARIQVVPPSTPPHAHRTVLGRGPGPLRAELRGTLGALLSPKDRDLNRELREVPAMPFATQSMAVPSTRPTSPGRLSPCRAVPTPQHPRVFATTLAPTPATPVPGPCPGLVAVRGFGERVATRTVRQWGLNPEMWGIFLDQLFDLEQHPNFEPELSTREVVSRIVWPETAGKGVGYALLRNASTPLLAAVMVSHAWDDGFTELLAALSASQGALWVAATALYQSEESIAQILSNPLELLGQVLRGRSLLCVLGNVNIYDRLWCLFEMSCAVEMGAEVNTTRKPKGRGAWALDEAFLTACSEPVDARAAKCGQQSGGAHEQALRRFIEGTAKGYKGVDCAVETARLNSLSKFRDQLLGGGWSTTGIGKQYADVMGDLCVRVGQPMPRPKNSSMLSPFPQLSPVNGTRELTPRTGFRQHWGKITSL
ncbi:unnamed protein product [Effrenium voratum]|uniref:Uncharacterized protein n=1 Tax=Effrenium voratum TaxID=2562239 RepID=A0AA36IUR1_9DINO|nr:unnamed protein product [Effrenium voratum]